MIVIFLIFFLHKTIALVPGCYQWNSTAKSPFHIIQNANPLSMTTNVCQQYCLSEGSIYAAVEAGQYCLCGINQPDAYIVSPTACNVTCTGYTSDPADLQCGSYSENAWIIDLSALIAPPIYYVTLTSSTIQTTISTAIIFTVVVNTTSNYTISFDYGDDSPQTDYYFPAAAPLQKTYYYPGTYMVTAFARNSAGQMKTGSVSITVTLPLAEVSAMSCPSQANIGEIVNCNFTFGLGTNVQLNLNFGDGSIVSTALPDAKYYSAGLTPPPYGDSSMNFTSVNAAGTQAFMKMSEFANDGTIYGFELGYKPSTASMQAFVHCPLSTCSYCYASNDCGGCPAGMTSTTASSTTCSSANNLYFNAIDQTCYSTTTNQPVAPPQSYGPNSLTVSQYDFTSRIYTLPTITQPQRWIAVSTASRFAINAGCVLGYKPTGIGRIGHRPTKTSETSDSWISVPGYTETVPTPMRHYLRAYSFQSQLFNFQHAYWQDGLYNVDATVSDGISTVVIPTVQVLVDVYFDILCPPYAIVNRQIVCDIIAPNASDTGTYSWDMGDGTVYPYSTTRTVTYTYATLGTFLLVAGRKSPTTGLIRQQNRTMLVVECFCCPPILTPLLMSTDYLTPISFQRSQSVLQNVLVQLSCNDTLENTKIWSLDMMDEQIPPNVVQSIPIDWSRQNNPMIELQPFSLPFGLYRITITVTMNSTELLFNGMPMSQLAGYFTINPSKIIPIIYQNQSQVTVTHGSSLIFNPGDETLDPNEAPGSTPMFSSFFWTCRSTVNTLTASQDATVNTWIPNCQAQSDTRELSDLTWGYITFDTTSLTAGSSYIVTVTVNRTVTVYSNSFVLSGTASLIVNVISGTTYQASIQCSKPEICYPDASSLIVNPTNTLVLSTSCPICALDAPPSSYQWTITDTLGNPINYANYLNGDGTMLSLDASFFIATGQKTFLVSFQYNYNGIISTGYLTVNVNQPPANGSCSINATSGQAGLDSFFIKCQNWISTVGIAHFVLYKLEAGVPREDLLSVSLMSQPIYLNSGTAANSYQYALWVTIVDVLGATTEYQLATVTITPYVPPLTDLLSQLALITAEGDSASILSYINSIASSAIGTSMWSTTSDCSSLPLIEGCDIRTYSSWLRSVLVVAIENVYPRTLYDVCSISNCLNSIMSNSNEADLASEEGANSILENINNVFASYAQSSSPELVARATASLFGLTSTLITDVDYNLANLLNLGDQTRLQQFEYDNYDVSLPDDPSEIVYYEEMTIDEWRIDAAKRAQKKIAARTALNIENSLRAMTMSTFADLVIGQSPTTVIVPAGKLFLQYNRVENLTKVLPLLNGAQLEFPDFCIFSQLPRCTPTTPIQNEIVYYDNNLYEYADVADLVTTGSIDINFFDPITHNVIPISKTTTPLTVKFPQNITVKTTNIQPSLSKFHILQIHKINETKQNSSFEIDIDVTDPLVELKFYIRFADTTLDKFVGPMLGEYDYSTVVSYNEFPYKWILPSDAKLHSSGIFYMGVGQNSPNDPNYILVGKDYFLQNFTVEYTVAISAPSCHYYSLGDKHWNADGCLVSNQTTQLLTVCDCYHLTTFGAGLFVPPNTIDFDYVFSHADFTANISIYMTIIVILVLYVVLVLWAKKKDQQDLEKLGCVPMPDNDINDHYIYEIVVSTGLRKNAATDSKVHIVISGELGDTDAREFGHPLGTKKIFRRGAVNHFVMTTKHPLGDLRCVRVWHDNSGIGEYASWYLKEIIILDIQTGRKYPFVCNQWLAVEHRDGTVDRLLPVSTKEELLEFNHLFTEISKKELFDGHIWFSVFARSPGSRFTRVQRVSCCLCVLFTSMLASAMWYGTIPETQQEGIEFGPFSMSTAEIGVGVMSSFIVFPINFIIAYLFRKSPQRSKRPSRFFEAFKNWMPHFVRIGHVKHLDDKDSKSNTTHTPSLTKAVGTKKAFVLPWFCRIVAWILVVVTVIACVVFIIFYGIQFGDYKCRKWLTSLFISFISSILCTEPLQIFLGALLFSLICRKAHEEIDDDWIQDEHDFGLKPNQEWLQNSHGSYRYFSGADRENLEQSKYTRKLQLGTYNVVREVLVYLFYIWVVYVLAYGSREPLSYLYQNNLRNIFMAPNSLRLNYEQHVSTVDLYWDWCREILAPGLRAPHYYNGKPNIRERGFIADRTNRLIGYATIRQVRVKPNSCTLPTMVQSLFKECRTNSHLTKEESHNFDVGWQELSPGQTLSEEFTYHSSDDLNGVATTGVHDIYSGGGYVATLRGPVARMRQLFERLQNDSWIDEHTRAVFVEFATFDANANLFSVNQIAAEFLPNGGILRWTYFQPIRLLPYHQRFSLVEVICQAIFLLYVFIFIIKEARNIKSQGCPYFGHFWSWVEISIIVFAISAVITYILRFLETRRCLNIFDETQGNDVISMQYALFLDNLYTFFVASSVFVGMIKLARLLRFNRRISLVETTIHNCKHDLFNFFTVFGFLFLIFCQLFFLMLQSKLEMFTNFLTTMCTIFATLLGKGQYKALFDASPILSPLFFVIFICLMSVLMVNIFLTIVITMFITVRHDSTKHTNDNEILDFMDLKLRVFFGLPPSVNQRMIFKNHHTDLSTYQVVNKKLDKVLKKMDGLFPGGQRQCELDQKMMKKDAIRRTD